MVCIYMYYNERARLYACARVIQPWELRLSELPLWVLWFIQELTGSEIRFFILMMNILDAEHLECLPFIVLDILLLLNGFGERDIDDFSILEPDHD